MENGDLVQKTATPDAERLNIYFRDLILRFIRTLFRNCQSKKMKLAFTIPLILIIMAEYLVESHPKYINKMLIRPVKRAERFMYQSLYFYEHGKTDKYSLYLSISNYI